MFLLARHVCKRLTVVTVVLAAGSSTCRAADTSSALLAQLKAGYQVARVGTIGLKYDYNHIVQPGTVLTVRIPGIYADPANTPQAIVGTVVTNGEAQQQRGFLSALSSTVQGRTFEPNEQVYVTKIDLKQDGIHFELLSAGSPRYRAEVKFLVPNLSTMDVPAVERVIGVALASARHEREPQGAAGEPSAIGQTSSASANLVPSRPGVAAISAEQAQKIQVQLDRAPAALSKQVKEAFDTLKNYVALASCINDYAAKSQLQTYLGPHGNIDGFNPPFTSMRFHNKGTCLDVTRIQGWTALSLNAFEFQVVYTAVDSGESTVRTHTAQQEPDGTWLMNH